MKAKILVLSMLSAGALLGCASAGAGGSSGQPSGDATSATPVSYPGGFPLHGAITANQTGSSVWYEVTGLTPGTKYGLFANTTSAEYKFATITVDKQLSGVGAANSLCPMIFFRSSGDSDVCSFTAPASTVYIDLTSPAVFDCTITIVAP